MRQTVAKKGGSRDGVLGRSNENNRQQKKDRYYCNKIIYIVDNYLLLPASLQRGVGDILTVVV